MSTVPFPSPQFATPVVGEPAWDMALLYPLQGSWSEEDYLAVAFSENWLIEYTDGCVEVLPMPTVEHQLIVRYFLDMLRAFVDPRKLGVVLFAPLPVKLGATTKAYREPDIVFNFAENHAKRNKKYYDLADLVMEVVSDDKRSHVRDYEEKRRDFAKAGILEYWIVDPQDNRVTVLALDGKTYVEHAVVQGAGLASSKLLDGFSIDVADLFAAGKV
jgi:Uma2 family endonuclease